MQTQKKTGHKVALVALLLLGVGDLLLLNLVVAPRYIQQRQAEASMAAAGPEVVKTEPAKTVARAEPVKKKVARAEPVKTEDAKTEPVKVPPKPEPARVVPAPVKAPPPLPVIADVRFITGSSELSARSHRSLDQVAMLLAARAGQRVHVYGHADDRGTQQTNHRLSLQRASSVARYLVSRGVSRGRIKVRAHGASRPLDRSNTPDAWGKNRRVEIKWK